MTEEEEWQKEIEDFFNQLKNEAQADLDEIKKWQTLATSICIGCIAGSLIDYLVKPNIIIITGALIIGLSMGLCAISFYLIRRSIIKQIKREVTAETDDIYDSVERLFGDLDELVEQKHITLAEPDEELSETDPVYYDNPEQAAYLLALHDPVCAGIMRESEIVYKSHFTSLAK